MVKKMKLSFLNKNTSSSSFSSNSSSSFSYWPWPSCHHQQNPKTRSFFTINKPININKTESHSHSFSSSNEVMEKPFGKDCIENVIRGIKVSKRLIFEHRGESNSILEESIKREEEKEEGFLLLSLESNDPYYDFKKSMEKMVEAQALPRRDWRSFEKLLFLFLKVNVKTSHKYIFAAFFDLLLNLEAEDSKDTTLV